MSYQTAHEESIRNPEKFWAEPAKEIRWYKPYRKVFDDSRKPFSRWFSGGELNTCYNALDFHVEDGRGEQAAIIYDSPVSDTIRTISYRELLDLVSRFAGVLVGSGVKRTVMFAVA